MSGYDSRQAYNGCIVLFQVDGGTKYGLFTKASKYPKIKGWAKRNRQKQISKLVSSAIHSTSDSSSSSSKAPLPQLGEEDELTTEGVDNFMLSSIQMER